MSQISLQVRQQQLHEDTAAKLIQLLCSLPTKKANIAAAHMALQHLSAGQKALHYCWWLRNCQCQVLVLSKWAGWYSFRSRLSWDPGALKRPRAAKQKWGKMEGRKNEGRCSSREKMQVVQEINIRNIPFHGSLCGLIFFSPLLVYMTCICEFILWGFRTNQNELQSANQLTLDVYFARRLKKSAW